MSKKEKASLSKPKPTNGIAVYRRLLTFVLPYWPIFLAGIVATAIGSLVDAAFVGSLRPLLDKGLIDPNMTFLRWLPLLLIIAFLIRGTASFFSSYCLKWLGAKVVLLFRRILFQQYIYMPTAFYDKTTSGELLSKVLYNVTQVTSASTDAIVSLLREGFLVIGLLCVMFINSWKLSLFFLVVGPIIMITVRVTSKRLRRLSQHVQVSMGDMTHILEEAVEGQRVVKAFGGQAYEMDKFNAATELTFRQTMKRVIANGVSTPIVQLLLGIMMAVVLFLATRKTGTIDVSPGAFVAMVASMLAILKPVKTLTKLNSTIQSAVAGAESVFDMMDQAKEPDLGTQTFKTRAKGEIMYKDVNFSYESTQKTVLQSINFHVLPGQTIALVGRSGAGKSTIASLLPRFYHDYTGDIFIDGHNIKDYQLASLRDQIALVTQQVTLFNGTIAHNIAYGCFDTVSETDILNAAKAAHILEFIEEQPEGLQTIIGENGMRLSGGQRQRLAIARAILKNAPILILDEATSSLDTESERHIQAALTELMKDRTTLVIAHRLSTIENADQILVLDHGCIMEMGDHDSLLKANNHYARLYRMQFKDEPISD